MGAELGFSGEVADFYHRYRRGYPDAVIDALAAAVTVGQALHEMQHAILFRAVIPLTYPCGTDEESQQRYREDLAAAGFDVLSTAVD